MNFRLMFDVTIVRVQSTQHVAGYHLVSKWRDESTDPWSTSDSLLKS